MKIGLEITHKCNRKCKLCDHRIHTSDYEMTREEFKEIVQKLIGKNVEQIKITGGEPTLHPQFNVFVDHLSLMFPLAELVLITNGDFDIEWPDRFHRIEVSEYPDNKEKVNELRKLSNVVVHDSTVMWNPYRTPKISFNQAEKYHKICLYKEPRVIGDRVYGCCLAEGIERHYKLYPIHIKVKNWDFEEVHGTKFACMKCFRSLDMKNNFKLRLKNRIGSWLLKHHNLYKIYKRFK